MSTAFFPQGMESYNNSVFAPFTGPYASWKGTGVYSNPVGITSGNVRPLTNKDYVSIIPYKHGSARPLKWNYRIGTKTQLSSFSIDPNNPIHYILNTSRSKRVSKSTAALKLVTQLNDCPGRYSVKENTVDEQNEALQADKNCTNCKGVAVTTNYYPSPYLTNNPLPVCTSPLLCCNEPKKALLRVRPASTILKKNYFTTLQQYRQNRCLTYDQRIFNFQSPLDVLTNEAIHKNNPYVTPAQLALAKPGSPLAMSNTYVANCYPNTSGTYSQEELIMISFNLIKNAGLFSTQDITNFYNSNIGNDVSKFVNFINKIASSKEAVIIFTNFISNPYINNTYLSGPSNPTNCKLVVYKPNNPQFAVQGAVSSSTRLLKLAVTTIEKNINNQNSLKGSASSIINPGQQTFTPFIYKSKTPPCNPRIPLIFSQITKNPKSCFGNSDDYQNSQLHNMTSATGKPNVATNGISATTPGGQPLR